jgi:hypothetical protein
LFRDGLNVIGFGWAIENPNDAYEHDLGIQFAFKRAIKIMLDNIRRQRKVAIHGNTQRKIDKAFRTALYKARNKNG